MLPPRNTSLVSPLHEILTVVGMLAAWCQTHRSMDYSENHSGITFRFTGTTELEIAHVKAQWRDEGDPEPMVILDRALQEALRALDDDSHWHLGIITAVACKRIIRGWDPDFDSQGI